MTISLVVRRTIRASVERVFSAWTEPAQVERWWGPSDVRCVGVEIDLRVGGRYRIGNELPDGGVLWIQGHFVHIEPPHRLVYTWGLSAEAMDERVTVRFESRDAGTEVVVVHELLENQETADRHEAGWVGCLDGLVDHLAARHSPLPGEPQSFDPTA